ARSAAARSSGSERIHVVDSKNASLGQGQLVVLAAECADSGFDIERTMALLDAQIPLTRSFALLHDLRYAVRGGRVPSWVKSIADTFRLKPIIATKPDGRISPAGFVFGAGRRIHRFAGFIARRAPKNDAIEVGIGHALCEDDARTLEGELRRRLPNIARLTLCALGPGLGAHGGPGTLLVAIGPLLSAEDIAGRLD
ncbi:MAG: DegV family EDD domain-containing protein, partial [Woeseiaceae bacterium]|nr:DegV family EDD domain-containing protein [Woeseiaceae bacterium]